MLHRLGSIFFVISILSYLAKYINGIKINKKILLKTHIVSGVISATSMIVYSFLDYIKEREASILTLIPIMILVIITGNKDIRKRFKLGHIISVISFCIALAIHIIL